MGGVQATKSRSRLKTVHSKISSGGCSARRQKIASEPSIHYIVYSFGTHLTEIDLVNYMHCISTENRSRDNVAELRKISVIDYRKRASYLGSRCILVQSRLCNGWVSTKNHSTETGEEFRGLGRV